MERTEHPDAFASRQGSIWHAVYPQGRGFVAGFTYKATCGVAVHVPAWQSFADVAGRRCPKCVRLTRAEGTP